MDSASLLHQFSTQSTNDPMNPSFARDDGLAPFQSPSHDCLQDNHMHRRHPSSCLSDQPAGWDQLKLSLPLPNFLINSQDGQFTPYFDRSPISTPDQEYNDPLEFQHGEQEEREEGKKEPSIQGEERIPSPIRSRAASIALKKLMETQAQMLLDLSLAWKKKYPIEFYPSHFDNLNTSSSNHSHVVISDQPDDHSISIWHHHHHLDHSPESNQSSPSSPSSLIIQSIEPVHQNKISDDVGRLTDKLNVLNVNTTSTTKMADHLISRMDGRKITTRRYRSMSQGSTKSKNHPLNNPGSINLSLILDRLSFKQEDFHDNDHLTLQTLQKVNVDTWKREVFESKQRLLSTQTWIDQLPSNPDQFEPLPDL